jgi:tetratricopeptide (TPR) repeat protein
MMDKIVGAKSKIDAGSENKKVDITINVNENSNEYKEYYYALERYLMGNCPVLKQKIGSNDRVSEKSMSNNPKAVEWYDKGVKLQQGEDYAGALNAFQQAVAIDPEFAFAWDNIGISFRRLGQYDSALVAYRKSLSIDPNGILPLQNIPIAYLYKQEYEAAIKAYDALAAVDPDNPEVFYGIGSIYVQYLKDPEKGLGPLCKAYNLYISQKSPFRSDAEKLISQAYQIMKSQGKSDRFMEILKANNISVQ